MYDYRSLYKHFIYAKFYTQKLHIISGTYYKLFVHTLFTILKNILQNIW